MITPSPRLRGNEDPIVLVAGFTGWGRDELGGFLYWGGKSDIQEELKQNGYPTFTAGIGPYSSNWDRACELYAMMKGGTVDYGKVHAKEFGHARFGRTYPGLFPQWGEENKIHIIGHSMGGQTARTLAQLLGEGSEKERQGTSPKELSPLFNGEEKKWIRSISTISTPHNGSTLVYGVQKYIPSIKRVFNLISPLNHARQKFYYDFKLDHWGLTPQEYERYNEYVKRVWQFNPIVKTRDFSEYDLSVEGAYTLNKWAKARPDIYYFSIGTKKTVPSPVTGYQIPRLKINPLFSPFSLFMGRFIDHARFPSINGNWWENDGLVNTISMKGPMIGSKDSIIVPETNYFLPTPGIWYYLGTMDNYDHMEIVSVGFKKASGLYSQLANLIGSLK